MNSDPSTPTPHTTASSELIEVDISLGDRERYPNYDLSLERKPSTNNIVHAPPEYSRYRDHRSPSIASQDDSTYSTLGSRASPDRDYYMDLPHHASDINFAEVDFGVEIDDDADTDWAPTPRPFDGDEEDPPEMGDSDTCVGSEDETTPKAVKDDEVGGGEDVADLSGVHHEVVLDGDVKDKIRGKGAEEEEMTAEMAEVGAKEEMEVKMSHEGAPDAASEDEPTPRLMDYCESDPMVDVSAEEHEENTPRHSSEAKEGYIDWDPPTPSVFALDVPEPTAQEEDNGYIEWDAPTPAIFDDELSCNEEMTDVNVEAPAVFSIPARTENKTQESPLPEIHPIALGNLLQNPKDIARLEDAIINYVLTTIPVVYEEITGYQLPVFVPTSGSSPRVSARSGQKRTSSGLSQSSGSAYSSNRNTPKKKRKNEDDDEDEDSRKRARRNGSPGTSTQMQRDERNYACLHYKHSPMRYPDCENRKWKREDIDLVASHIFTHLGPKFCFRCKARFRDEGSVQEHLEQPDVCELRKEVDRPSAEDVLVAEALEGELATGSWTWMSLYRVVFPDLDFEPSPFYGDGLRKPRRVPSRPVLSPVTPSRRTSNALPHISPPALASRLTGSTLHDNGSSASSESMRSTRESSKDSTKTALPDVSLDDINIVSPDGTIREHLRAEILQIMQNEREQFLQALQQPKATQGLFSSVKAGISTGFRKFLKDSKNPVKSNARMRDVGPV